MQFIMPIGVVLTLLGLVALIYCIIKVVRARKANLSDDEMNAVLQPIVAINLGALCVSAIGLGVVVVGILLG